MIDATAMLEAWGFPVEAGESRDCGTLELEGEAGDRWALTYLATDTGMFEVELLDRTGGQFRLHAIRRVFDRESFREAIEYMLEEVRLEG